MTNTHFLIICSFFTIINWAEITGFEGAKCKLNEFRCEDGSACLLSEKLCNGKYNCPNGEDELGNHQWDCSKVTLGTSSDCGNQEYFFKCRFGGCVPRSKICDGNMDCWGGTDEAVDLCADGLKRPNLHVGTSSRIKPTQGISQTTQKPTFDTSMMVRPPILSRPPVLPQTGGSNQRPGGSHGGQQMECKNDLQEEGVEIKCHYRGNLITCSNAQNGTIATYTCKNHFNPLLTTTTRRMCKNGVWTRRKVKWQCILQCGVGGNDYSGFITGGVESKIGKWPWNVGLYQQNPPGSGKWEQFCGGTLISTRAVITAAHCVTQRGSTTKRQPDEILLYFGKFFRRVDNNDAHVQMRQIERIHVHDYYDSVRFGSDIAIIWITKRVEITDRVLPACLPRKNDLETGDLGTLVGWGRYTEIGYPESLQEARIPVVSIRTCSQSHPSLEALAKSDSFCAGYRNGTSACDGDSGSGLIFEDTSKKWELHGIVSAGVARRSGGCDSRFYTIFTRVIQFREWIDKILDRFETR